MQAFEVGEVFGDELDVGEVVISQLKVLNLVHSLLGALHDGDGLVVQFFLNQRHDFLFLLVDVLDLLRNYIFFFGPVDSDIDEPLPYNIGNLEHQVLLEEVLLGTPLDKLVNQKHLLLLILLPLLQTENRLNLFMLDLLKHLDLNLLAHYGNANTVSWKLPPLAPLPVHYLSARLQ